MSERARPIEVSCGALAYQIALFSAVVSAGLGAGCGDDEIVPEPEPELHTIADYVRADERLSTLATALGQAGLLDDLNGAGPFTLFAPTNAAFAETMPTADLLALPELEALMRYHIHPGRASVDDLPQVTALATLGDGPDLHVRYGLRGILLDDGVAVGDQPINTENGVIHIVDGVLARPLRTTWSRFDSNGPVTLHDYEVDQRSQTTDTIEIDSATAGPRTVHDVQVAVDIQHPDTEQLAVWLVHEETGTVINLVRNPFSSLPDIRTRFADGAAFDGVDDVRVGGNGNQAFPEAAYRPAEPLEFAVGEALAGRWSLVVRDYYPGDSGVLRSWALFAAVGEEPPAPAIAIDRRALGTPVFGRTFSEDVALPFRAVGGLIGDIEFQGTAGELTAEPSTVSAEEEAGAVVFEVPATAPLGDAPLTITVRAGDVSRIATSQISVVDTEASGIQLLAHVPLGRLGAPGGTGNDVWGWTDPVTGAEIALVGSTHGTAFVDVSAPESPAVLGFLPSATGRVVWRDMKVYSDYAFIVSEAGGHGLQVFDLTQLRGLPRDVEAPQSLAATASSDVFGHAHNIAINEDTGYAYVVGSDYPDCFGGLLMLDIATPTSPTAVGCFAGGVPVGAQPGDEYPTDVYVHDAQCVTYAGPDTDYEGHEICITSDQSSIGIVDVTDKANPQQLARATYPTVGYTHQGWLTEDHAYFLLNDEFDEITNGGGTLSYVWDLRDLDAPALISTIHNPRNAIGHNTYIRGNTAFQANYTSGLRLLDITDIANGAGTEIAYFDTYPEDDLSDDPVTSAARALRCSVLLSAPLALRHALHPAHDGEAGCGAIDFDGAWSNYPFFASGTLVVSDMRRGLFVLRAE